MEEEVEGLARENRAFMSLIGKSSVLAFGFIFLNEDLRALGLEDNIIGILDIWFAVSAACAFSIALTVNAYVVGGHEKVNHSNNRPTKRIKTATEYIIYIGMIVTGFSLIIIFPEHFKETYTSIVYGFVLTGTGFSLLYWEIFRSLKNKRRKAPQ
ncbi:hypothetical protein [Stutzerimonas tarimensis]|uniref:Uncharacterized protein n=1 Tax=Stutzerimonas tarimensis TaxID=1507735 RepID=A0ABV7T3I6_9GAMM